jgi:trehalose 6-phosphate phosphatase
VTGDGKSLRPFAERPDGTVVVVDFDGTLVAIVDDPDDAVPFPGAVEVLTRLAARLACVAVVSGRPLAFLRDALPVGGLTLVGHYGLERLDRARSVRARSVRDSPVRDSPVRDPRAQRWAPAVEAAARAAEVALPGLRVERKGGLAVGLHWREAPELEAEAVMLGRRLAAAHGLWLQPARLAVELRPPLGVDKSVAVTTLADGAHALVVAGDDYGDIPVFEAAARLAANRAVAHVLRVAVGSAEVPHELLGLADRVIAGPSDLVALLGRLAAAVDG